MKRIIVFVFVFMASYYSFGQTEKETKKIVDEILAVTEKYNQAWGTVDMKKVAQFHSDSSFRYYRNMKLSVASNQEFKNLFPQFMSGTKSWTIEVINPVVQVLAENAAVIGFTGKAELITKDNKVSDIGTGAYTYVWKKTNGEWRIIHIHESAK